ncbi:MAG: hypothetical protein ACD_17C00166G0003 [uncultured bacterium]|nr:MAG: hypothetical protein ACD_17C00166G0003 [uncultured bacterium]OGN56659.1 MAG: hypothetical protein A2796_03765 [Chlamydiae bacterium RIFCSPHIGHO2_01_FULL_44_39]OGN58115.1 MAG: hypothetical protein A3C42_00425 [Chlamydiae bacterium RIFCSPHIGHO2_02_FULL_45_9]OGN61167.1 MAG: hypothetical protein A3D96_05940 [Chlamydiae bacterium RIFCSPHIGHO2_12_FULL_44_59]OGN65637.1 MAG: hypothetical protein A2978_06745 [Chlamydiae bacterium RIFCSPLOWO2_01_FULL_44_52]OGN68114.1 MAG: hypothetical protein A3
MLAGLIFDESLHYLDHLAPLCSLMQCPLIISEPSIAKWADALYPDLEILSINALDLKLPEYTLLCDPKPLLRAAFPLQTTKTVWLPHGRSDKIACFDLLKDEDVVLAYGPSMKKIFEEKKLRAKVIEIGNFRQEYYLRHQTFYQQKIPFLPEGETFFYAPTWDDSENNGSFWSAFPYLARNLPNNVHLLVKPHPNTVAKFPLEIELLCSRFQHKNITLLSEFPPIYPLLDASHAYIGDMSSIGYDFLTFMKPMFFINASSHALHGCGYPIDPKTFDFRGMNPNISACEELYNRTFGPTPSYRELKELCICVH